MINWGKIRRGRFDRLVEALLCRIHDEADDIHRAYRGAGGDGGIDYFAVSKSGVLVIYQLKCFPEGIAANRSRMGEIQRSFAKAVKEHPGLSRWVLVLPTNVTPGQETKILDLKQGRDLEIEIWDQTRLDVELAQRSDIPDYFRGKGEWLKQQAELMIKNPLINTPSDLARHVGDLQSHLDRGDLDWTWDVSTSGQTRTFTLRPKHRWASVVSPVGVSFGVVVESDHAAEALAALRVGYQFGFVQPLEISGHIVRNFRVNGPPLVAFEGDVEFLRVGPSEAGEARDVDLQLSRDGKRTRRFLATAKGLGEGTEGFTFEVSICGRMRIVFECPNDVTAKGRVHFKVDELAGISIGDAFDIAELVTLLLVSDEMLIITPEGEIGVQLRSGGEAGAVPDYRAVWLLADDLRQIELHTGAKFRFPASIEPEDRIMIRNYRLMLEGRVVAHPVWNQWNGVLNGDVGEEFDRGVLTPPEDPTQISLLSASSKDDTCEAEILGQVVELPAITIAGLVVMDDDHRAELRAAVARGETDGMPIRMRCRPGDRLRMFMPGKARKDETLSITPWEVPGINQQGILDPGPGHDVPVAVA